MGNGTFKEFMEADFNIMNLAEITQWQGEADAYKAALDHKLKEASIAARSLRVTAPRVPPLPVEQWIEHPHDSRYEYLPGTDRVRLRNIPPLPSTPSPYGPADPSPADPAFPRLRKSASSRKLATNGKSSVAVPNSLYDVYNFIVKTGVCFTDEIAHSTGKTKSTADVQANKLERLGLIRKVGPGVFEPIYENDNPFVFDSEDCVAMRLIKLAQEYKRPFGREALTKKMGKTPEHVDSILSVVRRMGFIKQLGRDKFLANENPPQFIIRKARFDDPDAVVLDVLKKNDRPMHYLDVSREAGMGYDTTRHRLKDAVKNGRALSIAGNTSGVFAHKGYQRPLPSVE